MTTIETSGGHTPAALVDYAALHTARFYSDAQIAARRTLEALPAGRPLAELLQHAHWIGLMLHAVSADDETRARALCVQVARNFRNAGCVEEAVRFSNVVLRNPR